MSSRRILAAAVSLAAVSASAPVAVAVVKVPYKPTGSIRVKVGTATDRIGITFKGTLPATKKGEYVAYSTVFSGVPKNGCTSIGIDADASPRKPRRTNTMLDPGIGVETPGNQRPAWCSGKWIVQAQIYKPAANRSFRPRLTFNVTPFKIA